MQHELFSLVLCFGFARSSHLAKKEGIMNIKILGKNKSIVEGRRLKIADNVHAVIYFPHCIFLIPRLRLQ